MVHVMKPAPTAIPPAAARRARGESSAPTPRPTSTAVAWETPRGTMKVRAERFRAIWWPATATVPRSPMASPAVPKAPYSIAICAPMGAPRPSMRRIGRQRIASRRNGRTRSWRRGHEATTTPAARRVRERLDAQPEPIAPSSGIPRLPYTNTQLKPTFARFATAMARTMGRTVPSACNVWRRTRKA